MLASYLRKMRGTTSSPPRVNLTEIAWSWVGAFLGIAAVSYAHYGWLEGTDMVMIIGSFGASAVLIYGAIRSPLAQPRNLVGGHVISALIGVASYRGWVTGHGWPLPSPWPPPSPLCTRRRPCTHPEVRQR